MYFSGLPRVLELIMQTGRQRDAEMVSQSECTSLLDIAPYQTNNLQKVTLAVNQ